jgi:DNA-binding MarR family transcriptional regulator
LIKRSFAKEDRRRSMLSLSNKGRQTYLKIVPLVQNYERDLLNSLTEQERMTLNIVADKLTHYVKEQY